MTSPKPYYQDSDVTLYCGDCREIITSLAQPDAIITDPPYGIGYKHAPCKDTIGARTNYDAITGDQYPFNPRHITTMIKPHGGSGSVTPCVIFGANHFSDKLPPGYWICWDKSCGMGSPSSFVDCEFAWSSRRVARNIYRQLWMGVVREGKNDDGCHRRNHPSQKPIALMSWCLDAVRVGLGKTVIDPYMGTGTTAIACLRTGRKFVGIEIEERYCEIAATRVQKFRKENPL